MVQTVPIHVGRVPVHRSEYIASLSWCHRDIQECKSPLFFLLNCVNVGGQLVEVCVEGLQVLLSMRTDDEGVIYIALQRKDKSANFSTSRTRDQQPTYNRLIARSWSSTSAKDHCLHRTRTSFPWVYPLRSFPDKSPTKKSSLPQRPLLTGWITEQRMPSGWQYVEPYNKPKPTTQPDLPATTSISRPQERREYCPCSHKQRQSYSDYGQRRVCTEDEADSG